MPDFVEPERVEFETSEGGALIRLDVPAPPADVLEADGWSALVRLTLVVVDGPGDVGYLVMRTGKDLVDPAPAGWDEAVDGQGAITVAFGRGQDAPGRQVRLVDE